MDLKKELPKNLEKLLKILSEDSLFSDIYLEYTQTLRLVLEPERIDEINWGEEKGIALRKITSDFQNIFSFSNNFDETYLEDLAKGVIKKTALENTFFQTKSIKISEVSTFFKISEILKSRINFLENLKKRIKNLKEIKHYKIGLTEIKKEIIILNSEETWVEEIRPYFRVGVIVVAEKEGRLERGYEVAGRTLAFEKAKELPEFLNLSEKASELALKMLSAKKAPAGVMPVILSGEAGGTMIHEAVGHGLEADHAEEGLSVYSGKIGEKVASELITVIDDATLETLYGYYKYDDEGIPSQPVVLIEKGILKNFLYDKFFSLKYGKKSNGHGRRQSYRYIPLPRMGNTYIDRGFCKPEDILKSIDKGLLVKKMGGGEVNPLTGDFVFEVREGYYIDKGEIAYPIKGATLVGNGPKVLEIIDMVGNDLHFEPGICGKDGQGVPVSDAQPTLRIPEITVGGVLES
ncbi:TldD/PmbA family protein [Thermodesulfobacterium hydrogeniphilum]|uniref:TldD/PmbA family protein n=1 Tax=Thermodesulfobacterium hydrogeniphilum TaxID=161156 RepID=UPI000571F528|nr:TldD/PmbA family protein [Thermodesulfobacterium hydrogeniphilum]